MATFNSSKPLSSIPLLDLSDSLNVGQAGWWLANDGAGARVTNIANPNRFNGALQSGVTWSNAKHGKVLAFDGTANSYVNLGTTALVTSTSTPVTLSWIASVAASPPTFAALACFFAGGATQRWLMFREDANGQYLRLSMGLGSVTNVRAFTTIPTLAGDIGFTRHWLLVIPDGFVGTASGTGATAPRLYVDGTAFTCVNAVTGALSSQTGNLNYLGWDGADSKWKGNLDNFRLWNRALTTSEINRVVANPFAGSRVRQVLVASAAPPSVNHRMFAAM